MLGLERGAFLQAWREQDRTAQAALEADGLWDRQRGFPVPHKLRRVVLIEPDDAAPHTLGATLARWFDQGLLELIRLPVPYEEPSSVAALHEAFGAAYDQFDWGTLDAVVVEPGLGFAHRALSDEGLMRRIAVLPVPVLFRRAGAPTLLDGVAFRAHDTAEALLAISPGSCAANSAPGALPASLRSPTRSVQTRPRLRLHRVRRSRRSEPARQDRCSTEAVPLPIRLPAPRAAGSTTLSHLASRCSSTLRMRARALATTLTPTRIPTLPCAITDSTTGRTHRPDRPRPASQQDGAHRGLPDAGDAVQSEAAVVGELRDLIGWLRQRLRGEHNVRASVLTVEPNGPDSYLILLGEAEGRLTNDPPRLKARLDAAELAQIRAEHGLDFDPAGLVNRTVTLTLRTSLRQRFGRGAGVQAKVMGLLSVGQVPLEADLDRERTLQRLRLEGQRFGPETWSEPEDPRHIALVVSEHGEVRRDVEHVLQPLEDAGLIRIHRVWAIFEGAGAERSLAEAFARVAGLQREHGLSATLVCRGGGPVEAFRPLNAFGTANASRESGGSEPDHRPRPRRHNAHRARRGGGALGADPDGGSDACAPSRRAHRGPCRAGAGRPRCRDRG